MNIREIFQNKIIVISVAFLVIIILAFVVMYYITEEVQTVKEKGLPEFVDDFSNSLENKKSPEELGNYADKFSADIQENEKPTIVPESVDNFSNNIKSNN